MPAVTINSLLYAGTVYDLDAVRRAPVEAKPVRMPITNILVGRDGTRNKMDYGFKLRFELTWDQPAPQATRDALWALTAVSATFPYIHIDSVAYTVQLETESDYDESVAVTFPNGSRYYTIKLILHQS
jgi:hypothetical protein